LANWQCVYQQNVLNNYFDKISISGYFITVTDHLPYMQDTLKPFGEGAIN
jgi:hypothetical protein